MAERIVAVVETRAVKDVSWECVFELPALMDPELLQFLIPGFGGAHRARYKLRGLPRDMSSYFWKLRYEGGVRSAPVRRASWLSREELEKLRKIVQQETGREHYALEMALTIMDADIRNGHAAQARFVFLELEGPVKRTEVGHAEASRSEAARGRNAEEPR